jgi:hypothetical protein
MIGIEDYAERGEHLQKGVFSLNRVLELCNMKVSENKYKSWQ